MIFFKHLAFFFALIAVFSPQAHSLDVVVPGDMEYLTRQSPDLQYIYPHEHAAHLPELDHYMRYFRVRYDASFAWTLDEKLRLAVASTQNQVANGFATPIPFLQTVHYPSGVEILDLFAQDSFLFALTSHETAHLYQISAKSPLSKRLKKIFGNTPLLLPIVPIFVFPNAFLPSFLLEGNAVLNESILGRGGRLWSGEVRAEVMAQTRAGKTGPEWLMNSIVSFPLSKNYHYSGYLFASMGEAFGVDKVNQFYITHANREFWPFNVNKSFREHYGYSYNRLIFDADQKLKALAKQHQVAEGTLLGRSFNRPRFNHDENEIYFVGNPTGRTNNEIFQFDRRTSGLKTRATDLPDGKMFILDGTPYTVSSERVDATHIQYALFSEGLKPKDETKNFVWMDQRAGQTLAVDAKSNYARNNLMKNGAFLDESAGAGILDELGQAYYFRQIGSERVLYRDRIALFKFKGYYGIPMQAESNGDIYFVASTNFGASLFRWRNQQIERLFPADNVVEARHVKDDQFLVAAVDGNGYEIRLVNAEPRAESPAYFDYSLPNKMPPSPPPVGEILQSTHTLNRPEKSYSSLGQLQFSSWNLQFADGVVASMLFADPLQFNLFYLSGAFFADSRGGLISYLNQRHRLGWIFNGIYMHEDLVNDRNKIEANAFIGVNYELFKWRRWNSTARLGPFWTEERPLTQDHRARYGLFGQVLLEYARRDGALAYDFYRHLQATVYGRNEISERSGEQVNNIAGAAVRLSGDVYNQTYLRLYGAWAQAKLNTLAVDDWDDFFRRHAFSLPDYLHDGRVSEVSEFSVQLLKATDVSFYFSRFPLSLRRAAPFVKYREISTNEHKTNRYPAYRKEGQIGIEWEFLLLHTMPLRLETIYASMTNDPDENDLRARLSFRRDF